jgi:hypothetical protein
MPQFAYATVVDTAPDAAHAIALAHSLRRRGSRVPLVVLHRRDYDEEALRALDGEADELGFSTAVADGLGGYPGDEDHGSRTGAAHEARGGAGEEGGEEEEEDAPPPLPPLLAVFGPALWEYETACAVAPRSVVVRRGMDLVFAAPLPTGDWLGAAPLCACPAPGSGAAAAAIEAGAGRGGKRRASSEAVACPYAQDDAQDAAGNSTGGSPVMVDHSPLSPASPLSPRGFMTPSRALSFSVAASQLPAPSPTSGPSAGAISPGARIDPRLLLFSPDERLRDRVRAAAAATTTAKTPPAKSTWTSAASSARSASSSSSASHTAPPPQPDRHTTAAAAADLDRASRILHAAFPARWAPLPCTYLASRALRARHRALDGGAGRGGPGGGLRIVCVHCEEEGEDGLDAPGGGKGERTAVAEEEEEADGERGDELAAALAAWRVDRLGAGGEDAREAVDRVDGLLLLSPGRRNGGEADGEGPLSGSHPASLLGRMPPELEARAVGALAF